MQYEQLQEELRVRLKMEKKAFARYSSLVGQGNKVDDAVLLDKSSDMDMYKMEGYTEVSPSVWFEYVSDGKSDEEAVKMVKESLDLFE